jgi:hypothetical protein
MVAELENSHQMSGTRGVKRRKRRREKLGAGEKVKVKKGRNPAVEKEKEKEKEGGESTRIRLSKVWYSQDGEAV